MNDIKAPSYKFGSIKVRPVFVLPAGADASHVEADDVVVRKHLAWAQGRYAELLRGNTFEITHDSLRLPLSITPEQLVNSREGGAPLVVRAILAKEGLSRTNAPYVYLAMYEGTGMVPAGGGRPINGGHNLGGGIIIISAESIQKSPNFQSTLQHELGHGFGLLHVDAYGYDMIHSDSMMSYNPKHHTSGFEPSPTPARFIPEDIRGLAENHRAFPKLKFLPSDVPAGYTLAPDVSYPPMNLDTD